MSGTRRCKNTGTRKLWETTSSKAMAPSGGPRTAHSCNELLAAGWNVLFSRVHSTRALSSIPPQLPTPCAERNIHMRQGAESVPAVAGLLYTREAPKKGSGRCQARPQQRTHGPVSACVAGLAISTRSSHSSAPDLGQNEASCPAPDLGPLCNLMSARS